MTKPRAEAERVVRRIADHTTVGYVSKQLLVERIARAIRREVKRAVEEEREACAQVALGFHDHDDRISWVCEGIERAIRGRK